MPGRPRAWWMSWATLLSVILLTVMFVVLCQIALANKRADESTSLLGTYTAQVESPVSQELSLSIPGRFGSAGLEGDPIVRIAVPVDVPAGMSQPGVLISRVRYALEVYWDGERIGGQGTIGATDASGRTDKVQLLAIPEPVATPGWHELALRVEGAYGEGGVFNDVRFGEYDALLRRVRRQDMQAFGLSLAVGVLGIIQLILVIRRPQRREHLFFGLLFVAMAIFWFSNSDAYYQVFQELGPRLRIRRASFLLLSGFALLWTSQFAFGHTTWLARGYMWLCGVLGALAALWPDLWLNARINEWGDYIIIVLLVMVPIYLFRARSPDRLAVWVMGAAALLAAFGVGWDIVVTRGVVGDTGWLMAVFVMVIVSAATALSLKHSDAHFRYATLLHSALDGVIMLGARGQIDDANPAAQKLLVLDGARPRLDLRDLLGKEEREAFRGHLAEIETRGGSRLEFHLERGKVQRWLESVGSPLDGGRFLLVLRDITHRRFVEAGLARTARLETLGLLAGGVARDFHNLMNALRGYLGGLKARLEGQPEFSARIDRIDEVAERAAAQARRFLALANTEQVVREPIDITRLVLETQRLVQSMAGQGAVLEVGFDDDIPPIQGSPQDLQEVLVNLVLNAFEEVPAGSGRVTLSIRMRSKADERSFVELCVDDNGPGIPPDRREQVFDVFYSTKEEGRATGLGLAVVRKIIRDHGGDVVVGDSPLGGARFRVMLPCDGYALASTVSRGGRRILLVEDEVEIREMVKEVLVNRGFHVASAEGFTAAVRQWEMAKREFDLLLTDVVLRDGSGLDLADKLQGEKPGIQILVMSGFIPRDRIPQAMDGQWRYLAKPFRLEQLVAQAKELLT